jgi:DNA-binding NarL/FixJ family response regulator
MNLRSRPRGQRAAMTIGKPFKGSPQPTPVDWARLALCLVGTRATFDDTAHAGSGGFRLLTDREMQVFNLLFKGVSVNDIATRLGISNKTVSTHKVRLMEKLELSNMVDLIHYAQKHQLNG